MVPVNEAQQGLMQSTFGSSRRGAYVPDRLQRY